ncbi:7TM diverse intracellular signaling domain-containing protein [Thiohalorhabdus sp. Cl-TMA]|uniref:7TM diverse intracellular signaling domain-containing protein n=1 Tax=Thiohalorhabdus methylotrophus TaxID=3242694 RepID=A0ABV4U0Z8_9GAMM
MSWQGFWAAVALVVLTMVAGPAAAAGGERVTVGAETRQPIDAAASLHRHDGAPLTLEAVRAVHGEGGFRSLAGEGARATNFGLTRDEIWLRLPLSTKADLTGRWLLEVGHASLDRVDLYLASDGGGWRAHHSGDQLPFRDRPIPHRNHVFDLDLEPATDYTLYLRVASEGTLTAPLTIWRADALWAHDLRAYAALGLYYGILLALLIYNLFLYLSLRDPLYLNYVAFIATLAIGQAGLAGFTGQFLWPENPWLTNLTPTGGVSLAGFFGALFVRRFLGDTPSRVRLGWLMPLVAAGYAAIFLCVVLWSYHLAALSVNLLSLVFAAGALGLGAVSLYQRQPGARFFVLAWVALLTGVVIISLHNLGVLPSNVVTANALLIGSAMEMLLLSLALADRIQTLQQSRDEAQEQALRTRQEKVEALRESERQLEQRVAERTHDLERANQDLMESQAQLEYQAGHDPLTGLVNRNVFDENLEAAMARGDRHGHGLALVVGDLDRFKPINDSLGHAAGDQVLVQVADRLRGSVRQSDTVGRLGGDEFVILLEEVGGTDNVETVVEKINEEVARSIRLEDGRVVHVGLSLGWARYPADAGDEKTLFRVADRAMYSRKTAAEDSREDAS